MAELDVQYLSDAIDRVKNGDENAFAELYAATYQRQYLFSCCYLGEKTLAKGALEETYLLARKKLDDLVDPRLFVSWISQINFRVCYSANARRSQNNTDDTTKIQTAGLKQLLALPFSESQAIFLYYYRKISIKNIAYLMDISGGAVKQYIKSGLSRLGNEIETAQSMKKSDELEAGFEGLRSKKQEKALLNEEEAQNILTAVYEGLEKTPCKVPLNILTTYVVYRKDRYRFQKSSLIVIMLLFVILPIFFYIPKVILGGDILEKAGKNVQLLQVKSLLPVQNVDVYIDGKITPVSEVEQGIYEIDLNRNGELTAEVTVWNGQTVTVSGKVDLFDTESPYLVSNYKQNDQLYLVFADDQSGVDFSTVRIVNASGEVILPEKISPESGEVILQMPKETLDIYVDDNKGNTLQLMIGFGG